MGDHKTKIEASTEIGNDVSEEDKELKEYVHEWFVSNEAVKP